MKYTVSKVIRETPDTVSILFDGPKMSYLPGQFIMINYPLESTFVKRAYSIASSPTQDHLQICVKETPNGFVSKELQTITVGTEFEITGPFGRFVFDETKHKDIVLLGAGSGIVPYLSILQYIADKKLDVKATLFTSQKTGEDCIYNKEFEKLASNPLIFYHSSITREENTDAHEGRITKEYLLETLGNFDKKTFFLCGPKNFVLALKEILLGDGVAKEHIEQEVYG
jgi:ferredoxin-NADP reductase